MPVDLDKMRRAKVETAVKEAVSRADKNEADWSDIAHCGRDDWEEFDIEGEIQLEFATDGAAKFLIDEEIVWIPKSLIFRAGPTKVVVPEWWAEQEGFAD